MFLISKCFFDTKSNLRSQTQLQSVIRLSSNYDWWVRINFFFLNPELQLSKETQNQTS